jgi:2-methylcitrate dehydratase PrpD
VSVVPAAFAAGEQYTISGAQFVRAVTLGYDIGTRVTMSMGGPAYQAATHRSTHGTVASFASGAAAGCAASLNAEQMRLLLDYSAQQTSGIGAWSRDAEHMEKAFLFGGRPAAGAVLAASLIRAGWSGVDDIFSGSDNFFESLAPRENGAIKADPNILIDKLGERYEITRTNIKKWTVGSPIQAPLDALAGFFKQRQFSADDVKKVVVRVATDEANTVSNRDIPDICMEHMVAVMLLDKTVTFQSVHDKARMKDPAVLRQRAKVEVVADARIDARRPRREAIVELTLNDGTELTQWVRDVRGTAENPMTREEVVDKARDLIAPVLGNSVTSKLIDKLLVVETLKDIRELRPDLQRS